MALPKVRKSDVRYRGRIFDMILEDIEDRPGFIRTREIIAHPGGGVIVPLLDNGSILLVRQYRYPMKEFMLELPAGKLEPGENPRACAKRELLEETGYTAQRFRKLTSMATTPGFCSEILHIFLATGLKKSPRGQMLDEGEENLTLETLPLRKAVARIENGALTDSKTIAGILLAERYLARKRK